MNSDDVRHALDQIIGATATLALELELMRGVYDAAMDYVRCLCSREYDADRNRQMIEALLAAGRKAMDEEVEA